ncbi:TetR/AcrR family transcriptional regulator [Pseudooceanicola sp. CBS1P-1]|uniref:TetR family transcriptional regulator n=1 Tax=Pseudooceanicola albus TaxID=2692189 RepID=A0A6L7G4V2_9RHOB|nr:MULTISPECIES: TetR/AcrR family transcriptional regulator [Pseudooceanicola]MBT9385547.1 TetR/AcrR family transcriptional regulator [Pseudooceanicola endophyticus]MXN19041.1 TetR family transcriptional regulator [Pseudooceanicola albus]
MSPAVAPKPPRSTAGVPSQETARRQRILDAARRLYLKRGIRRSSVEDISRAAGIAKGSVYLEFSSKEEIFATLAAGMTRDFLERAREALTAEDELGHALAAYLDHAVGEPWRVLFSSPHAQELVYLKRVVAEGTITAYEAAIWEDVEAVLHIAGLPAAATQMIAAAHGCTHVAGQGPGEYRRLLSAMIHTLLMGLSDPQAVAAVEEKTSSKVC